MQFGVCTSSVNAPALQAAGWDFVEDNVQSLLQATNPAWQLPPAAQLPVSAANCLVPGALRIVGPSADPEALRAYMTSALERAARIGINTVVFGSGAARNVPEDFDREEARRQIESFLRASAPIAHQAGVTIVIEPLHKGECNIINSVAEAMTYVKAVDHPRVRCLVDSYHFWTENEPLENLQAAMPWIAHVHVADRDGRTAPGESGTSDYRPFFSVLKQGGYDRRVSVECKGWNTEQHGAKVLAYLKDAWQQA